MKLKKMLLTTLLGVGGFSVASGFVGEGIHNTNNTNVISHELKNNEINPRIAICPCGGKVVYNLGYTQTKKIIHYINSGEKINGEKSDIETNINNLLKEKAKNISVKDYTSNLSGLQSRLDIKSIVNTAISGKEWFEITSRNNGDWNFVAKPNSNCFELSLYVKVKSNKSNVDYCYTETITEKVTSIDHSNIPGVTCTSNFEKISSVNGEYLKANDYNLTIYLDNSWFKNGKNDYINNTINEIQNTDKITNWSKNKIFNSTIEDKLHNYVEQNKNISGFNPKIIKKENYNSWKNIFEFNDTDWFSNGISYSDITNNSSATLFDDILDRIEIKSINLNTNPNKINDNNTDGVDNIVLSFYKKDGSLIKDITIYFQTDAKNSDNQSVNDIVKVIEENLSIGNGSPDPLPDGVDYEKKLWDLISKEEYYKYEDLDYVGWYGLPNNFFINSPTYYKTNEDKGIVDFGFTTQYPNIGVAIKNIRFSNSGINDVKYEYELNVYQKEVVDIVEYESIVNINNNSKVLNWNSNKYRNTIQKTLKSVNNAFVSELNIYESQIKNISFFELNGLNHQQYFLPSLFGYDKTKPFYITDMQISYDFNNQSAIVNYTISNFMKFQEIISSSYFKTNQQYTNEIKEKIEKIKDSVIKLNNTEYVKTIDFKTIDTNMVLKMWREYIQQYNDKNFITEINIKKDNSTTINKQTRDSNTGYLINDNNDVLTKNIDIDFVIDLYFKKDENGVEKYHIGSFDFNYSNLLSNLNLNNVNNFVKENVFLTDFNNKDNVFVGEYLDGLINNNQNQFLKEMFNFDTNIIELKYGFKTTVKKYFDDKNKSIQGVEVSFYKNEYLVTTKKFVIDFKNTTKSIDVLNNFINKKELELKNADGLYDVFLSNENVNGKLAFKQNSLTNNIFVEITENSNSYTVVYQEKYGASVVKEYPKNNSNANGVKNNSDSDNTMIYVGIGIGIGVLALSIITLVLIKNKKTNIKKLASKETDKNS